METLTAPANVSFSAEYTATADFLCKVREKLTDLFPASSKFLIEMATIRNINMAGALCMTAEFDRWQRINGRSLSPTTLRHWDREVVRRLSDMGFFSILGTKVPAQLKAGGPEASRFIRFITSVVADPRGPTAFRREVGEPLSETSGLSLGLYRSLSEAIANAVEHAYPEGFECPEGLGRRWWLAGSISPDKRRLSVAVLDHGVSIPGSLPRSKRHSEILEVLLRMFPGEQDDGRLIEAAMEFGRSRLRQPERGKGLGDVLSLALAHHSNRLRVISRNGYYVYEGGVAKSSTRAHPLNGTLVQWDLALQDARTDMATET